MKKTSLITFAVALMFVLNFPLTAHSADFWGILRDAKDKVIATCNVAIDTVGNKTFTTLNFLKGKKDHGYTAWQNHTFAGGVSTGNSNLDGTLAAGKTVNLRGHRYFESSGFDVVNLEKVTIDVRDHNKVKSDVDDADIIMAISTPSSTVKGEVVKLGKCVIDTVIP